MNLIYLYIKRHSITGKCYFGKTCNDPLKYNGSGKHWINHIKKHGIQHVETLWYKPFTDQSECTRVALLFSEQQNITKSDRWLNFIPENGLSGGVKGIKHTAEHCKKISISNLGKKKQSLSKEHKEKISLGNKGKIISPESRAKISLSKRGKKRGPMSEQQKQKISTSTLGKKKPPLSNEHKEKLSIINKGKKASIETRNKMSESLKGHIVSKETCEKISKANKNPSLESRNKMSIAKKGKSQTKIICPYCMKEGGIPMMKRWHFDNCKSL